MAIVNLGTSDSIVAVLSAAVSANQPNFVCGFIDTSTDLPSNQIGTLNSTTEVTLVSAPATGIRQVDSIQINNTDTAPVTVTVSVANGVTRRVIYKKALAIGETGMPLDASISLANLASDAAVVHLANPETVTGLKTFTGGIEATNPVGTNALASISSLRASMRALDGLVMPNVLGYLTNTPPASPSDGDCYIIGAAPTGAWVGKASYVTRWSVTSSAWEFYLPKNGWMLQANSARESYRYTGGAWEIFYQEGTWTPSLSGTGGSLGAYAASIAVGTYTRIGHLVLAQAEIVLTNKGSWTGATLLNGMPFPSNSGANTYSSLSISLASNIVLSAGNSMLGMYVINNSNSAYLLQNGSGIPGSNVDFSSINNDSILVVSGCYQL